MNLPRVNKSSLSASDANELSHKSTWHGQLISVVFPVFNEEENLTVLYEQVQNVFLKLGVTYEMVFVDNGSQDSSLKVIKSFRERDRCVRYISLSRNFGHQGALLAGMSHSRGDAVITMDADLQHPPGLISEMLRLWKDGNDVVFTVKREIGLKLWRRFLMKIFYGLISKLSGLHLKFGQSDFRLLDRKVVKAILAIPEYRIFLRGIIKWIGFKQVGITYDVATRFAGGSKFSFRSWFSFALDGILAFSVLPLRWVFLVGLVTALGCFAYMGFLFVLGILSLMNQPQSFLTDPSGVFPPGWVTLAVSVMFLGGIQLVALGVLGEYLGRVFDQTKGRPIFVVRERSEEE